MRQYSLPCHNAELITIVTNILLSTNFPCPSDFHAVESDYFELREKHFHFILVCY